MTTNNRHSSSFRDPSGFIFVDQGVVKRSISPLYFNQYNALKSLEFFKKLQNAGLLIKHEELSVSELASRAGIPKRRVRKHMKFKHFLRATVDELYRYADVFNIPVANFFQIISTKQDVTWNIGHNVETAKARPLTISQEKTPNPLLVITNPEKSKP